MPNLNTLVAVKAQSKAVNEVHLLHPGGPLFRWRIETTKSKTARCSGTALRTAAGGTPPCVAQSEDPPAPKNNPQRRGKVPPGVPAGAALPKRGRAAARPAALSGFPWGPAGAGAAQCTLGCSAAAEQSRQGAECPGQPSRLGAAPPPKS